MNCRIFLLYGQSVERFIPLDYSKDPRGALPLLVNHEGNLYVHLRDDLYAHAQPTLL